MNKERHTIAPILKVFVFITIICAMVFQPITQKITLANESDIELADMDSKEDSNERENQEEDPKEEKIELQIINSYRYNFLLVEQMLNFGEEYLIWDFSLEIHIPPPEQV